MNPARVREALLRVADQGPVGQAAGAMPVEATPAGKARARDARLAGEARAKAKEKAASLVVPRSSSLCAGCSHLGSYWALRQALQRRTGVHIVNGDIGCYEQGGYGIFSRQIEAGPEASRRWPVQSPYEILDTNYVMGGGIGLAQGQAQAGYREGKILAVAGDSTFAHATLPAVLNAAYNGADITFLVLANNWTAMTGHQPNPTTGVTAVGDQAAVLDIAAVASALGVSDIRTASAYDLEAAQRAIAAGLDHTGPSLVILTGECQLQVQRRTPVKQPRTRVDHELCNGCRLCVQLGCPAVTFDPEAKRAGIDSSLCVDCSLCAQVCPRRAVVQKHDAGTGDR
ncbi:MAG TPA: 4Fe-4S binding protein [Firmicutes bacterium]|nr:4Fe-4S binding protein [Bacillota bacterium]